MQSAIASMETLQPLPPCRRRRTRSTRRTRKKQRPNNSDTSRPHRPLPPQPALSSSSPLPLIPPPSPSSLTSLSSELLLLIAHHLDAASLIRTLRVHRELRSVIVDPLAWRWAHFRPHCKAAFLSSLLALTPHIHLTSLDLSALASLTSAELHTVLLYTSSLTSLSLACCPHLSNRAFLSLTRLTSTRLHHLTFPTDTSAPLDAVSLSLISLSNTHLHTLRIAHAPYLPHDCLLFLSDTSTLTHLTLRSMRQLTDASFSFLTLNSHHRRRIWPLIQSLDLSGCRQLTDRTMALLAKLPSLTSLDVSDNRRVTAQGAQSLSDGQSLCREGLRALTLAGCSEVTDDCASALLDLPALTSLSLDRCSSVTAQVTLGLSAHPTLQRLALSLSPTEAPCNDAEGSQARVHALRTLWTSKSLRSISLRQLDLHDEGMNAVWSECPSSLSSLSLLDLRNPELLFAFLRRPTFPHLTTLELHCHGDTIIPLTAGGVGSVTFPSLRRLSLQCSSHYEWVDPSWLAASSRLLHLDLSCMGVSATTCRFIAAHFPLLATLTAHASHIDRNGLVHLSHLAHLHTLALSGTSLSPTDLTAFTTTAPTQHPSTIPFPALESLSLLAAPHTDLDAWRAALRQTRGADGLQVVEEGEERRLRDAEEDDDDDWEPPDHTSARREEREDEEGEAELVSDEEEEEEEGEGDVDEEGNGVVMG